MDGIGIYGALNDKNDPDHKRRKAHAELYYETRRHSNKEFWVKKVAENAGMSEKVIGKIFDHVFIEQHDIYGELKRFDSSYDMGSLFGGCTKEKIFSRMILFCSNMNVWKPN